MDQKILLPALVGGVIGGVTSLGLYCLMSHGKKAKRSTIERIGTQDPRSSKVVKNAGILYVTGQVGEIDKLDESGITEQTKQTLFKIDKILNQNGLGRDRILSAQIWLKNIDTDFQAMNAVWNAWVDSQNKGVRVCTGGNLAKPSMLVEVQITAAL